ncbi:MAG: hypothetical protein SFU83_01365 [Meiothermus sp.]|nr:hypothetical protein [Meiothermus sp.]
MKKLLTWIFAVVLAAVAFAAPMSAVPTVAEKPNIEKPSDSPVQKSGWGGWGG